MRPRLKSQVASKAYRVILILALAAGLSWGCSNEPPEETGGAVTIRFLSWKLPRPNLWHDIIAQFEAAHPGIKVLQEVGPNSSTALHDMLTQKLKNKSPDVDVFLMDVIWPPEFASAAWALALDQYFAPEMRRAFFQGTVLANSYNGHIYGVPLFTAAGVLYYRKDLLAEQGFSPPATWSELLTQARAIVQKEKRAGRFMAGYSGQFKQYEGLVCDMLEFIFSNGGAVKSEDGRRSLLSQPPALEAVRFVASKLIGGVAPRGVLTYEEPESLALFVQGRAVFLRNWPYAWSIINDPKKSQVAGKAGLAPLPAFPGGQSSSVLGGWQLGISAYSRHPRQAWLFVEFVTSQKIQKLIALEAGRAPTRRALYDDPEVLEQRPHFAALGKILLGARPRPRSPIYPAISEVLQEYFSQAISRPGADIPALARQADERIRTLLTLSGEGRQ